MSYNFTPGGWLQPKPVPLIDTPQGQADLKLIVQTCYEAILKSDEPSVRWQAARLLQNLGPMRGTMQ